MIVYIDIEADPSGDWGDAWELECDCEVDDAGLMFVKQVTPLEGSFWAAARKCRLSLDDLDAHDLRAIGNTILRQRKQDIEDAVRQRLVRRQEDRAYAEAERQWELKTGR